MVLHQDIFHAPFRFPYFLDVMTAILPLFRRWLPLSQLSNENLKWSEWRDLNPRQLAPKASGLPDCPTLRNSSGARNRNRTDDLHLTKMALFHLSYAGMEPSEGLEPPTWNLQGSRSAN